MRGRARAPLQTVQMEFPLLQFTIAEVTAKTEAPDWVLWCVFAGCVLSAIYPRWAWFMEEGWKFREDVEPSGCWLLVTRITSAIGAVAVFMIIRHGKGVS